ncbi:MAG: hypothetical protein JJ900_10550 [Rhodospirillales bacterium]|nr:hypothetical protein [Rhodospirillales bacterium]MBO6787279.1 hypothetical protein [Rhodospirillales bacterium]
MRLIAALFVIACLVPASADAQNSRYSTWSDPSGAGAGGQTLDAFIEKLNKLIDDAEKAKAADPVFLQDLRNLANGAKTPWNTVVLDDSFADGNFTANPVWEVKSGEYFIETGWGLRNRLITAVQENQQQQSGNSGDELAKAILGTILKRATKTPTTQQPTSNIILTRVPVSNAFALDFELSSWEPDGMFDIGVFQGQDANIGYRLLYASGKGVQIHRIGSSGSSVIATSEPLTLEDKKFHAVSWTRGTDGTMRVTVDGTEMIATSDRAFSDPFDGIRLSNTTGDFIVKRITAKGI